MRQSKIFALLIAFLMISYQSLGQKEKVSMRDTTDGALDMSNFLLSVTGFLPVPVIITEPAIGYGGGLFGAYFHKKDNVENTINRPDITIGGGGLTENGTWFAGGGHLGFWKNNRIRYQGFLFYANPKIAFYFQRPNFIPESVLPKDELEVNTEMELWFFLQRISFKIGNSKWYIGPEYIFYSSMVRFDKPGPELINKFISRFESDLNNSGLGAHVIYDKRDNMYTTNKGLHWETNIRYFPTWLGTTIQYGMANSDFKWFTPVYKNRLYFAFKNSTALVFDNAPFFSQPFVNLRGVKAMRYQGEFVNTAQGEARFRLYKRWSLLAFGGMGLVSPTLSDFTVEESVWAGGTGFRYMLARLFNLQAGLDFAWSEKDPLTGTNQFAFYITVGSAL